MHIPSSLRELLGGIREGQHIGHRFKDDGQLVEAACQYVADGLRRGEAVIVVATATRWASLVGGLATMRGVDLVESVMKGQLRSVDAEMALASVMVDGMPEKHRFMQLSEDLIARARARFGAVRVFGEMGSILSKSGNPAAATRLEEFWKGLAGNLPFALLYPCHAEV
ncbi:MAG TPA: MEDS domain-containing protein [Noviherbaspirillum sp.]|nr:MEDS domain-containing protein [Noviherbaspirillum sp.]